MADEDRATGKATTGFGSLRRLFLLAGASMVGGGCLPGDDRPPPASILATAGPSDATKNGFETADGWSVRLDRFVTAVGGIRLRGPERGDDSCNDYAETWYEWLIDFGEVDGRDKVGLAHGLGHCQIEYRIRGPSDDTVVGAGVTEGDLALMIAEGSDAYAHDEEVSILVEGQAQRGDVTKRFSWAFRRSYEIEECPAAGGGGLLNERDLTSGESISLDIEIRGEEIFREGPDDEARLHFDPFAEGDRDGDGVIELLELDTALAPDQTAFEYDEELDGPGPEGVLTLAGLVYRRLLPRVSRIAGGEVCKVELDD